MALGYFFAIPISAGLVGLVWLFLKELRLYGVILLIISLIAILLFQPWTSLAIWEYVMAIISTIEGWFIVFLDRQGHLDILKAN